MLKSTEKVWEIFVAKSDNLLAILWMLQSEKKVTANQISEHLEINVRTVYRYIKPFAQVGSR